MMDKMVEDTGMQMNIFDKEKYNKSFDEMKRSIENIAYRYYVVNGQAENKRNVPKSNSLIYYRVGDVMELLGISEPQAYKIIRELNEELKKKHYVTVAGRISKVYFHEKYYGLDKLLSERTKGE